MDIGLPESEAFGTLDGKYRAHPNVPDAVPNKARIPH